MAPRRRAFLADVLLRDRGAVEEIMRPGGNRGANPMQSLLPVIRLSCSGLEPAPGARGQTVRERSW
jgi:hypothetical protein